MITNFHLNISLISGEKLDFKKYLKNLISLNEKGQVIPKFITEQQIL